MKFCLFMACLVQAYGVYTGRVIFYHIPKTAGCTTTFLLNAQFDDDKICKDAFYFQVEKRSENELKKFDLIRGHFFYASNLEPLDGFRLTIMREPIARVLSEQRFQEEFYKDREATLSLWHGSPEGNPVDVLSNQQVLYLSSYPRSQFWVSMETHFQSAKKNLLERFNFVGITEDYENSIRSLFEILDWDPLEMIPRLQSASLVKEAPLDKIEEIKKRNHYDILLYEFAKELFYTKYQRMPRKEKVPTLFYDTMVLDFTRKFKGEGFMNLDLRNGYCGRTISPTGFAFVKCPLQTYNYCVTVFHNNTPVKDVLELWVGGERLHLWKQNTHSSLYYLPSSFVTKGHYTKIELKLPSESKVLEWDRVKEQIDILFKGIRIEKI